MVAGLLALAQLGGQPLPRLAFVDAPGLVRLGVPAPLRVQDVQGKVEAVVAGRPVKVLAVKGVGPPERLRLLAREPGRVVLPGSLQGALGDREWDPDGESTLMTKVAEGVYELVVALPKGRFEYKVARNGTWEENWGAGFEKGGGNIVVDVPADRTAVRFVVDFNLLSVKTSLDDPTLKPPPGSGAQPPLRADDRFASFEVTLDAKVGLSPGRVAVLGAEYELNPRHVLDQPEHQPREDMQFGAFATRRATHFAAWTPLAEKAELIRLRRGRPVVTPLRRGAGGTWTTQLPGDLTGTPYRYRFYWRGTTRETADIWGRAATADGKWSVVANMRRTSPPGWAADRGPELRHQTDAVLYELSVRDFTSLPSSGVRPEWRGKYLGMVQQGTRAGATRTGLDHIKDLGVSHLHVLPTQSFLQGKGDGYSWGYATNLFNVPEESFATEPTEPLCAPREFKLMVQGLHRAGVGLVMDVVYNHTWPPSGTDSPFEQTVPHYFFREDSFGRQLNESGVGNALADERAMARRFVRDSLRYWLEEYHVDGFRFDLIGMFHPESVADWVSACRRVRPDVVFYGEPWTGGGPTYYGKGKQAGTGVGVFNDDFRNAIRGELDGPGLGAVMGRGDLLAAVETGLRGSPTPGSFAKDPTETINYFSAHDNLTWRDKLARSMPDASAKQKEEVTMLAFATLLVAQGVPFLEGGVEIGRTKGGNRNSYDSGDQVNGFHWDQAKRHQDTYQFVKDLVRLRRQHPMLRLATAAQVAARVSVEHDPKGGLVLKVDGRGTGDSWPGMWIEIDYLREPEPVLIVGSGLGPELGFGRRRIGQGVSFNVYRWDPPFPLSTLVEMGKGR